MCVASISILFWCELGSHPQLAHGLWNCQTHFMEIRQPRVLSSSYTMTIQPKFICINLYPNDVIGFKSWPFSSLLQLANKTKRLP